MLHHLFFLPFVIFHFVVTALLIAAAFFILRPMAMVMRHRCASGCDRARRQRSPDNTAFEDYRQATLKRLEQEAEEFRSYLARLRRAADAAAFEAFLKARKAGESPAS
jgi:type III secretory pathway component EscR